MVDQSDMSAAMAFEFHDQNNNFSTDRKNHWPAWDHFITMPVATICDERCFHFLFDTQSGWRVQSARLNLEPFILNPNPDKPERIATKALSFFQDDARKKWPQRFSNSVIHWF